MQPDWSRVTTTSKAPTVRWASREAYEKLSSGAITKPDTLNYRTLKPEPGGLFDAEVFGSPDAPMGPDNFSAFPHVGVTNLEPPPRFGHFELAEPVVHPLWLSRFADDLAAACGWTVDELRAVANYESLVQDGEVVDANGEANLENSGVHAIMAQVEARGTSDRHLFLDRVFLIPVALRAMVPLDDGRFVTSDLNDLYRRVVNRGNRLRRLKELDAPAIIIINEARMLQDGVNVLFDNGHPALKTVTGPAKRPLVSLLGHIKDAQLEELFDAPRPLSHMLLTHEARVAWSALLAMGFEIS